MEQVVKPEKKWTRKKTISLVLFVIIFGAIIYVGWTQYNRWWQERQKLVKLGFAEDKFPYRILTERELVEKGLWPVESQELMNVPTRITPEETYAKFKQALIDGDIDKAVECFTKEKQAEYRASLTKAKDEGRLPGIIAKLTDISPEGERVIKGSTGDASTTYELLFKEKETDSKFTSYPIFFEKNWNGDWLMEDF